jgi:hypothetical protein
VVDANHHAIGLIFGGMSELPESQRVSLNVAGVAESDPPREKPKRIEGYGVANPIGEVLDGLGIELLI